MAVQSPIVAFSIKSCLWRASNPILSIIRTILQWVEEIHPKAEWMNEIGSYITVLFSFCFMLQPAPSFKSYFSFSNTRLYVLSKSLCMCPWACVCVGVQPSNQQHSYWSADCWVRPNGPLAVCSCQGWELIMTGGVHTLEVWQAQGTVPSNNSLYYWHQGHHGSLQNWHWRSYGRSIAGSITTAATAEQLLLWAVKLKWQQVLMVGKPLHCHYYHSSSWQRHSETLHKLRWQFRLSGWQWTLGLLFRPPFFSTATGPIHPHWGWHCAG